MVTPHNELARRFVYDVLGEAMKAGAKASDIMIVLESAMLAAMLLNAKHYKMPPPVASGLVEAAVQRAIVRFSEQMR